MSAAFIAGLFGLMPFCGITPEALGSGKFGTPCARTHFAIVRAITTAHNATLTARPRHGGGLAIEVGFPADMIDPAEEPGTATSSGPTGIGERQPITSAFNKLDLPASDSDHRRVLAVLRYLRAGD